MTRLRSIARSVLLSVVAITSLALTSAAGAAPFRGPFTLNDGVTLYFVNEGGQEFDLTVRWRDPRRNVFPRPTLVRVFDPRENLVERYEFAGDIVETVPWEEIRLPVNGAGPGVYQVIVNGYDDAEVEVATAPELGFGVFGHLQYLTGKGDQFSDAYVYLPPALARLPVVASKKLESLALIDDQGQEQLRLDAEQMKGEVRLPAQGEHVWRLSARGSNYRLDFKGLPIILCPSRETAAAIKASVDIMPDGTVCFHKHQVRAWQLLQEYRQRPAADYEVEVRPLEDSEQALLADPARNQLLFGHYGVMAVLPAVLSSQCLAPSSPWFGAILGWKDEHGQPRTDNPCADYNRLGREALAALNKDLAALYWMEGSFNPYHHDERLLNRVVIGVLLDSLVMREGEHVFPSNIYYYGNHGFALTHSHSGAFSLVYRDVPPEVQEVWHAGQQRVTDRYLYGTVGGCTNQWTVLLEGLWRYYEGTGEERYREAVLRNAHWLTSCALWNTGQRPAGYMTEALGPDATYNGITGHYLSYLYHRSGEPELLEALRRCFHLFNHTVAPEPEGPWLGSSGFCHRTPGDWTGPQYGAGLGTMSKHLPEAGVRYPDHAPWAYPPPAIDEASRRAAEAQLSKLMRYYDENHFDAEKANAGRALGAFDIMFTNWRLYRNELVPGTLPCQAQDSFTRNFGGEFLCVKRPGYYAFLFGAQDYQLWQKGTRPQDHNHQFPHNDGLCMFWSPEFGVSLLSKNWGAAQGNTLLADLGDEIQWPWYWDTTCELDEANATAKLTGTIHKTPLGYERLYRFEEDHMECAITVRAEEAVTVKRLSECIPFPLAETKPGGLDVKLLDAGGKEIAGGSPAKALYFTNAGGQGHLLVLGHALPVDVGQDHSTDHYKGEHDWGRALIALPSKWASGAEYVLEYSLRPAAAATVKDAF